MNYKSPIEVAQEISSNIIQKEEEYIVQEVCKIGIQVDKDELLKALAYDRNQYEQGYQDALKNSIPIEWFEWLLDVMGDGMYNLRSVIKDWERYKEDWGKRKWQ